MNVDNMNKLADFLDALPPDRFDMADYWHEHKCRTVGCIAGWAVHLLGTEDDRDSLYLELKGEETGSEFSIPDRAAELLGLTAPTWWHLFTPNNSGGWLTSGEPYAAGPQDAARELRVRVAKAAAPATA